MADAQTASLASTAYQPGRYVPLRVEADAAGLVRLRGPGVQGVDWPAAGRSVVTVPLLIYGETDALTIDVNGHSVRLTPTAIEGKDAVPPELAAFRQTIDPLPPAGPAFDDDAHQLAALWQPGRSEAVRQWTLTAVAVGVLVFAVARYADPKRATRWTVVAAAGLSVGVVVLFPKDAARRVLRAEGRPGWEWVWHAGEGVVEEPWTPGLRFVPRSANDLTPADPVLTCDAAGRPISIRCHIAAGGRAVFSRPRALSPATGPGPR